MSYAVGSLVRARGREWVVLPDSADDLLLLRPLGATDDEVAGVLTALEPVEPARFAPPDPGQLGDAHSARLLRDALRLGFRSSAGPFRSFGRVAVTPRPYQLVPLLMALKLEPVRLLIADDVGIGKTIEAGLIARELLDRGEIRRLAVLCPPHLAEQWTRELREKFHLPAEPVLASTAARLERNLGIGESLFDVHDHVVVSTDFIKSDRRRDDFVRACPEFVIVDEAHTFAFGSGGGRHQRHELLQRLSRDQERHIVLVTATPHSGKDDAFRSLLGVLDPALGALPEDLSGPDREGDRVFLAAHLVQRRRADIRAYLDDTPFPTRLVREETYQLDDAGKALFDDALAWARESVLGEDDVRRQRLRWWSALALLRALGSSPAAAAATLRNRAANAAAATVEAADELGRRSVLDEVGEEDADEASADLTPGAQLDADDEKDPREHRRLMELARRAEALEGAGDPKLRRATAIVKRLVADGASPIVFCRFIPTAEYVAEHLRATLGRKVEVIAVTGTLAPAEREQRVAELGAAPRRVLVATDCLSEGINLQDAFDAVVHYDLAWNPTRHEQREGRVDRYGQPRADVHVVTFYGANSPIDGIVLDVLLRKHRAIRKRLGISVPVPVDAGKVGEAIWEGLVVRGHDALFAQTSLFAALANEQQALFHDRWDDAADREQRSRTRYAQRTIRVDDVRDELEAARAAIGTDADVRRFVADALRDHGAVVHESADGSLEAHLEEVPRALREAIGMAAEAHRLEISRAGTLLLDRTHPVVDALAAYTLDTALDPLAADGAIAARAGVMRTRAVAARTTLLLLRLRIHLAVVRSGRPDRELLAEDVGLMACTGRSGEVQWLAPDAVEALLEAEPAGNVTPELARRTAAEAVAGLGALQPALEDFTGVRAAELLEAHRRVRSSAGATGRFEVAPQLPPDVLGAYVLLPVAEL